ncbi:hypothetical protein COLU111180_07310 [Cohnella lubricantis]|uniref:Uncharacterized protein n=1 Tax=Cohnella lubricantis TaxID=2163172 RepID=A0A841TC07_9BACL|nr:hypothetical protein [Cohnella lubricantis]MBB6678542.1 hypothetical protein [Cohnella lubricantis]MBP2119149.1 putative membrane protein YvbJ [Cohnella lubricantis]
MLCPTCGSEEAGKFCQQCGTALAETAQAQAPAAQPMPEAPDEAATTESIESIPTVGSTDVTEPAELTESIRKARVSFWSIGTLIYMVAGAALFGYTCVHYWT